MSWLLVAFIPGLLMLATFGLERLEAGLEREDTKTLRRNIGTDLLERRRPAPRDPHEFAGLPTRPAASVGSNPQFPATRQPNRV
ncbi:hypothetical protein [Mycolicibacterium diernhoferi]|uniref:Uncharacterized protein n=1 Tax=Mycolicibacterium diernhoferi TaxID=1801 RepID=A0A1Q4H5C8_9MYCO|nr:hypothetical protein [Mycolicibacterium diernhoferi]OJZ62756.1 hypothetical protein BRW64_25730 [Mycolicibacterium diernhoferi]OPE50823.1 hypothetical protein BV510_20375 [Mycolicibacterium diernhoferi]PEG52641.1 hypothetical protein CRI78_20055 [Mycolicibacterium diernhoferi]QYL22458.1 hypothetical protein K0O62_26565 [Mycolicibacterium diernhoferi]